MGLLIAFMGSAAPSAPVQDAPQQAEADTAVENLRAFAKLYGYVKYFHPSDAASAVDWDRFAIHGVRQVQAAATPNELRERLTALFAPIAPTVQVYPADEEPPPPARVLTPADTAGLDLVAWQHQGVDLGYRQTPYQSIRLNRESETSSAETGPPAIADILQMIDDATPYHGKEMNVRAAIKTDGGEGQAHLWLFASGPNQPPPPGEPVTSPSWNVYEWTQPVAENAEFITFGGFLQGAGTAWFDDFELRVREDEEDPWTEVPIDNSRFEEGDVGDMPDGWMTQAPPSDRISVDVSTVANGAHEGEQAVRLELSIFAQDGLFDARPEPGEVVNRRLGRGLAVQIPLALYGDNEQTLRPDAAPSPDDLNAALEEVRIDELTAADEALRFGNVIIAWNVFQHFYPYFDVVDVDWDAALTETLHRAQSDASSEDFLRTLQRMIARLDDGHGRVQHPIMQETAGLPVRVDRVEDRVAVVAVANSLRAAEEACVQRGDVVASVDGVPVEEAMQEAKRYISGSPQWKEVRALNELRQGERGTTAQLVLERSGRQVECSVTRDFDGALQEDRPPPIEEIRSDVYYVDLTRAEPNAIQEHIDTLAEASGIVFDMRGYPQGENRMILRHLSAETLRSAHWQIPQIIYPDRENRVGYTASRWTLPPEEPKLEGSLIFLTDARALSQAESIMGIVEHYRLGEIVGRSTAGVNGNVNPFALPGNYRVLWTGMRVVKHDRSQHHLIGIRPTVPVDRTLDGIREGRDEDLEKALEMLGASPDASGR